MRHCICCLFVFCSATSGAESILRIDFGPEGSGSRHGYHRLGPQGKFQEGQTVGWIDPAGLAAGACDQETVTDARGHAGFRRGRRFFHNDVTRDYLVGRDPAVLAVAPGFEPVWLGIVAGIPGPPPGSHVPPILDVQLDVDGRRVDAFTIPQSGILEFRAYAIEGKGLLRIGLSSPSMGWVINGLILASREGQAAASAEWEAMKQEAHFVPAAQAMWWRLEPEPTGPATDHLTGPYLVVPRSAQDDMAHPPDLAAEPRRLRGFATPGQTEGLAFSVFPLRPLSRVRVAATDLTRSRGLVIPSSHVAVQRICRWPRKIDRHHARERGRYSLRHELLRPAEPEDMPAQRAANFYANVRVPRDTVPGHYLGYITVEPQNAPPQRLSVELRVLPVSLPERGSRWIGVEYDPPSLRARQYQDTPWHAEIQERLLRREQQELSDLLDHGVNGLSIRVPVAGADTDEARMRRALELYHEHKLKPPLLIVLELEPLLRSFGQELYQPDLRAPEPPPGFFEALRQAIGRLDALAKAHKTEAYYMPYDYRADFTHRLFAAKLMSALKTAVGDRLVAAGGLSLLPYVDPFTQVHCYSLATPGPAPFEERHLTMDLGRSRKALWLSSPGLAEGLGGQPALARYESGLFAHRHGAQAVVLGAYQGYHGSPFNAFDALSRGEAFTFPGPHGPLSTLAWEGVRQAHNDVRYAEALAGLIAATRGHAKSSVASIAYQAERDARQMLSGLPSRAAFCADQASGRTHDLLPRLRWRMAWWLGRLSDLMAGRRSQPSLRTPGEPVIDCASRLPQVSRPKARKLVTAVAAGRPPVIDGKLDDPCWQKAQAISDFVDAEFGTPAGVGTQVQVCADGANLYIAFRCEATDRESREECRFEASQIDAPLWLDSSVHVFLDPNNSHRDCFQIGVNRKGAIVDLKVAPRPNMEWNSGVAAKAASNGNRWTVEMAIPKPKSTDGVQNDFWGFNAARRLPGQPRRWLLWNADAQLPRSPAQLGALVFERWPCHIADVRMGQPHAGMNRCAVKLVNHGRKLSGRLTAITKYDAGRSERTHFQVALDSKASMWYSLRLPLERSGPATLALALYEKGRPQPLSTVLRSNFEAEPVVRLNLWPTYCVTNESVHGSMRIRLRDEEWRHSEVLFTLRRRGSRRQTYTQKAETTTVSDYSVRLPLRGLRTGDYELEAKVVVKGKTQGSDTFHFVLFDDF